MKRINRLLIVFSVLFLGASCEIERVFPEYDDIEHGAFPRLVGNVSGAINFFDPSSSINFEVEFYDDENGNTVDSYEWTVSYANSGTFSTVKKIDRSQFVTMPSGLPGAKVSITFQELLSALGLERNQVEGGSFFNLQGKISTNRGQTFTAANADPTTLIPEPAFRAFFQYRANIVCPSALAGTYAVSVTGTSTDGCCPDETTLMSEVTLTEGASPGVYSISDFSGGLYLEWFDVYGITPSTNLARNITDACGTISGSFSEPFGEVVTVTGSVNDDGTLTIQWVSGWGDQGVMTLTKKL